MSEGAATPLALPVELLAIIASLVRQEDLLSLLLVNKHLNEVATPYIHATIDIYDYSTAKSCLKSLSSPCEALALRRDLAPLVRTFRIHEPHFSGEHPDDWDGLSAQLCISIERMVNLREFRCNLVLKSSCKVLYTLIQKPHLKLESISLRTVPSPKQIEECCDFSAVANLYSSIPNVRALNFFASRLPSPLELLLLRNILTSCAHRMRSISLGIWGSQKLDSVFPENVAFPELRELKVDVMTISKPLCTALAHVRSLSVRQCQLSNTVTHPLSGFLSSAFPAIEELACYVHHLPAFFHPNAAYRRPIHTVRLNYVRYDRHKGEPEVGSILPCWEDLRAGFQSFKYSAVPIKRLGFYVSHLDTRALRECLVDLNKSLESLLITLDIGPIKATLRSLGPEVLAHIPRLHTLLISDITLKNESRWKTGFYFARDLDFQGSLLIEYEKCVPALRRVAFTIEFEWEKSTNDGRWYPSELVDPEAGSEPETEGRGSMSSDEDGDGPEVYFYDDYLGAEHDEDLDGEINEQ